LDGKTVGGYKNTSIPYIMCEHLIKKKPEGITVRKLNFSIKKAIVFSHLEPGRRLGAVPAFEPDIPKKTKLLLVRNDT
jgi:hypothetical protein